MKKRLHRVGPTVQAIQYDEDDFCSRLLNHYSRRHNKMQGVCLWQNEKKRNHSQL